MTTAPPAHRTILQGDVLDVMRTQIPDNSIDCVITSPPYYQLRVYHGAAPSDQWGTEPTLDEYLSRIADLFAEVRRVLKPTGTFWFNVGDGYSAGAPPSSSSTTPAAPPPMRRLDPMASYADSTPHHGARVAHVRAKSIMAIPHRILINAIDAGWICRNDIIWHKLSAVPASMKDRLTTVHEHLFLLAKEPRYYFDLDAIRVPHKSGPVDLAANTAARAALRGDGVAADASASSRQVRLDAPDQTAADPRVLRALRRRSVRYDATVDDVVADAPPRTESYHATCVTKDGLNYHHDGTPFNHPSGKNPGDVVCVPAAAQTMRVHSHNRMPDGTPLAHPSGKNPGDVVTDDPVIQSIRTHFGNHTADGVPLCDPRGKNPGDVQRFRRTFDVHGTHVAAFPESLAAWCLAAGCPRGGTVLDPFFGSGTTGLAAEKSGRLWCGIELSAPYIAEARRRLAPYANGRLVPLPEAP